MSSIRNGWLRAIKLLKGNLKQENIKTVVYIGQDKCGNKYFEVEAPAHQWRKSQRFFKRDDLDESTYAVDLANVPPIWDAWLRYRRKDPPSEEEQRESEEYFKYQQTLSASKAANVETSQREDKVRQKMEDPVIRESKMPKKRSFPKLPYREL